MTDPRDEGVDPIVKTPPADDRPGAGVQGNPADTAQEAVHQVMLREDVPSEESVSLSTSASVAQRDPSNDLRRAEPRSIAPRASWIQEVDVAGRTWPWLERPQLLRTLGRPHLLSALIQRSKGLSRDVADERVRRFFETLDGRTSESHD